MLRGMVVEKAVWKITMMMKNEMEGKMTGVCNGADYCDITNPDVVNEPEHYKHGTFEVIDEMLLVFGPQKTYDFCILNAWKYRSRAPYKGKTEEDMQKASRYMEMAYRIAKANDIDVPEFIREYEGYPSKRRRLSRERLKESEYGYNI